MAPNVASTTKLDPKALKSVRVPARQRVQQIVALEAAAISSCKRSRVQGVGRQRIVASKALQSTSKCQRMPKVS